MGPVVSFSQMKQTKSKTKFHDTSGRLCLMGLCVDVAEVTRLKTAEAAADNATIAADIKKRLLLRLQRIEAKYPFDATEIRTHEGKSTVTFRIRDLTAAYKDITEDLQTGSNATNELLQSLMVLERRAGL